MKHIALGLMIGLAGIIAVLSGAPLALTPLTTVGAWEALGLLSNLIVPLVGALVAVVLWIHRRLNTIEDEQADMDTSLFGNERDHLNEGVLVEVRNINRQLERLQQDIDELKRENERLRDSRREKESDD